MKFHFDKRDDSLAIMNLLAYNQLSIAYINITDWVLEITVSVLFFTLKFPFQHLIVGDKL